MEAENQILKIISEAVTSGALGAGWLVIVLLGILFRKQIVAKLVNGTNGNLQKQLDELTENHLHDITDRLENIERDIGDIRERLASVETELKISRERG